MHAGPPVTLGERRIAGYAPVYVIAEAGVNHNGCPQRALEMVDAAADAGADAVKFQIFRADTLVTRSAPKANYQRGSAGNGQYEMLQALELDDEALRALAERAAARAIHFLATPFSCDDVERLDALGVPGIKLSSADLNNQLLLECCARRALPLIVSTGAAHADEIEAAVAFLDSLGARDRLILLHCVSAYPTPLHAANLRAVRTLAEQFEVPTGFSDHTESLLTGAWAVLGEACVLEKHFTLDRTLPGPDQRLSLTPADLQRYITQVRNAEQARGNGLLDAQAIEDDVRKVARRSLVLRSDLPADTELQTEHLTAKRPAGGIAPEQLNEILGRRLKVAVTHDTPLQWDMLR